MTNADTDTTRQAIYRRFRVYVQGKRPDLSAYDQRHDGAEGDWLTRQMGLTVNGKNAPDFDGYEMKKDSKKVTFGDWSPDVALYSGRGRRAELSRMEFLRAFGVARELSQPTQHTRYSWSGEAFPKLGSVNGSGQKIEVDRQGNITIFYNYGADARPNKAEVVPQSHRKQTVQLVQWSCGYMRKRVESKFNVKGWFICLKNDFGVYDRLLFGPPITFERFINLVRDRSVYCDCGMHSDTVRPYMTWRAAQHVWRAMAEADRQ
jgi:hypothetical protein